MSYELLIAAGPGEWRAAWVEDGKAVELYVERGDVGTAGSVHLGRVVRRAPSLDSVFVEIGDARPGLLPLREAAADGIGADEGARIIVQVRREAQQDKGARLSARLRLAAEWDRSALIERAASLGPPNQLFPAWGFAAALALRTPARSDRVVTDDPAIVVELRAAFPASEIATLVLGEWPLDVDAAIEAALSPHLALAGGGTVHIQPTRAAVLVDVDTGTPSSGSADASAISANIEAVQLIARQLRLRNVGGGVVVDFVGLEGRKARDKVRQALETALQPDPARPEVLGWTRLGHLELVRPRRGRPLAEALLDVEGDAPRKQAVAVAHEALRALQREARANPAANWRLVVAPAIRDAMSGQANDGLRALESRLGRTIDIVVTPGNVAGFDIVAV